ncbi:MAG: hypothetical protein JXA25_01480 [Anaerolineales bacterium]|nr:hypothetical protein [Anaerolineales bacterium]
MKKVYTLSNLEVWALATLVYMPMDGESILAQWLAEFDQPELGQVVEGAVNTLEAKGYIDTRRGEDIFPEDLLEALFVLALSRVRLTAAISRNGKCTWSTFGQLQESAVQYELDGTTIQIHPPEQSHMISSMLVPDWFEVNTREGFEDKLPAGAFIMLRSALELDVLKAVLEENEWGPIFSRSELIDAFSASKDWVDVYNAIGISDIQPVSRMPIKEYFDLLYDRGYLQQAGSDTLQIGAKAAALAAAYADPDLCVLTLSMEGIGLEKSASGALVYGEGRLFLLRAEQSGQLSIEQLNSTHPALGWASDLIARGSVVQAVVPDPPDIESIQTQQEPPAVVQKAEDGYQSLPSYSEPVQAYTPAAPPAPAPTPVPAPAPAHSQPVRPQPVQQQIPAYQGGTPPPIRYQAPPKKKRSGCLIAAGIGVILLLCIGLAIGAAVFIFGVSMPWDSTPILDPGSTIPQSTGQAPIWVENTSNDTICYFYISPSGENDWGPDQLGSQETILPGGSWIGSAAVGVVYDLAAFDCADNLLGAQYGVTITAEGITFTLTP